MSDQDKPSAPVKDERRRIADFNAYFNAQFEAEPVYIEPGGFAVHDGANRMIVAMAGSGVILTVHDKDLRIGGAASVLMPRLLMEAFPHFENAGARLLAEATKPMEECIAELKRRGAGKNRIHVRLMGGAALPGDEQDQGTKNYVFAREFATRKGLPLINEDWGGSYVRRVHFFPATGRAVRLMLRRNEDFSVIRDMERKFAG